jgi:hypothetical protein
MSIRINSTSLSGLPAACFCDGRDHTEKIADQSGTADVIER